MAETETKPLSVELQEAFDAIERGEYLTHEEAFDMVRRVENLERQIKPTAKFMTTCGKCGKDFWVPMRGCFNCGHGRV